MIALIRQVESNFQAAGYDETTFRFVVDPDAMHTETAWEKTVRRADLPVRRLDTAGATSAALNQSAISEMARAIGLAVSNGP